jgi:MFS family permease
VFSSERVPLFTPRFVQLWVFSFITFFSAFQLFPTIPFRILALGGTKAEAGLFLAMYTYACAFSAPLTGSIADHFADAF